MAVAATAMAGATDNNQLLKQGRCDADRRIDFHAAEEGGELFCNQNLFFAFSRNKPLVDPPSVRTVGFFISVFCTWGFYFNSLILSCFPVQQ